LVRADTPPHGHVAVPTKDAKRLREFVADDPVEEDRTEADLHAMLATASVNVIESQERPLGFTATNADRAIGVEAFVS